MTTVGSATLELRGSTSQFQQAMEGAAAKLKSVGSKMQSVGQSMTLKVSAPIAAVGAAGFKMASDLESSFARMEGLVGVQREQLDAWEGDVQGLAQEFGISATKAADALFFITSAGLEGSDAMDALEASMKASASGLGEVSTIADLATSAMNAYGPETLEAAQATDVLTAAVREGKLEPDELAGSMGRVIPVASAMGIRFDEVGAAMAAMSRTGTNAAEAATQLRSIMTGILKPTATAEGTLDSLGLSAQGLREQIRDKGLLSVLQTLSDRFQGNDEAAAAVFGNVRALSGVMDLMGSNAGATAEIFGSLEDSTGALDSAFGAMSDTTKFELNQAIQAASALLIQIGQAVLPVATEAFQAATRAIQPVVEWFSNLDPRMQKVIVLTAGVVAAIGPMLVIFGTVVSALGAVATAFSAVAPVALAIAGVFSGPVVVAIGAAVAAGVLVVKNWDTVKAAAGALLDTARSVFTSIWTKVRDVLGMIEERFRPFTEALTELAVAMADMVEEAIRVWELLFRTVSELVGDLAARIVDRLVDFLSPLARWIKTRVIDPVVNIYTAFRETVRNIVVALANAIVDTMIEGMTRLADGVKAGVEKVTGFFQGMADTLVGNSIVPDMVTAIGAEFTGMADGMVETTDTAVEGVTTSFDGLSGALQEIVGDEAAGILQTVEDVLGVDLVGEVESVVDKIEGLWTPLGDILRAPIANNVLEVVNDWKDLALGIADAIVRLWDLIKPFIDRLGDFLSAFMFFSNGSGFPGGGGGGFPPPGGGQDPWGPPGGPGFSGSALTEGGGGGSSGPLIGSLTLNIGDGSDSRTVRRAVRDGLVEGVDRALGRERGRTARLTGEV